MGKKIPEPSIRVLRKNFTKQSALSDAEDNASRPLNRGGIAEKPESQIPCK